MLELYLKDSNVFQRLIPAYHFIDSIVEAELNTSMFKQLIADQSNHFDLVLVERFSFRCGCDSWKVQSTY